MRTAKITYRITRHDIRDNLLIEFVKILEIKVLKETPDLDEECVEITVEPEPDE